MKKMTLLACALVLAVLSVASARTWYVKPDGTGDAPTIQAGVDSATAGDEVVLGDGTFTGDGNRDIEYGGKAIVIRSHSRSPAACIIDCEALYPEDQHHGFRFLGEGPGSVLEAVTVTNAWESWGGPGGAVQCSSASPTITDCVFSGNSAFIGGGMGCASGSSPAVINCTFYGNFAFASGGIVCQDYSCPTIRGCTFSANTRGALAASENSSLTVENTIIAYTMEEQTVICDETSAVTLSCCNVYGNAAGDYVGCIADQYGVNANFSACPSFCNAGLGDFHLCDESPCLPGNHPDGYDCALIGAWGEGCICGPSRSETATWSAIKSMYR